MKILYFFIAVIISSTYAFAGGGGGGGAGAGGAAGTGSAGVGSGGAAAGTGSAGTGAATSASGNPGGPGPGSPGAASAAAGATGGTLFPTGNAFHYGYMYTDVKLQVEDLTGTLIDLESISISEPGETKELLFSPVLLSGTNYQIEVENTAPGFACEVSDSSGTTSVDNEVIASTLNCFSQFETGNLWSIWPRSVAPGTELKLSGDNLSNATIQVNEQTVSLISQSDHEIRFLAPVLDNGVQKLDVLISGHEKESYFLTYNAIQVSALGGEGGQSRCALLENGQVSCWGWRLDGAIPETYQELGQNSKAMNIPTAYAVTPADSAIAISSGMSLHNCYIDTNTNVHCLGGNHYAGFYSDQHGNTVKDTDVTIPNTLGAVSVSTGTQGLATTGPLGSMVNKTCAVMTDMSVKCWLVPPLDHENFVTTNAYLSTNLPTTLDGFENVIDLELSTFGDNVCALRTDGQIQCIGTNEVGQLGNGTTVDATSPVIVSGINNAVSLSYNGLTGCAVLDNGNAKCWGQNSNSDFMGIGSGQVASSPVEIHSTGGLVGSISLSKPDDIVCSANTVGNLTCWGTHPAYTAEWWDEINAMSTILSVSTNNEYGWCFVEVGGGVRCSTPVNGREYPIVLGGLLMPPSTKALGRRSSYNSPMAMAMPNLTNIKKVAVSEWQPILFTGDTCALSEDGSVSCWGDYDDDAQHLVPKVVDVLSNIADITMKMDILLALDESGNLFRLNNDTLTQLASDVVSLSNSGGCYVMANGNVGCLNSDYSATTYFVQNEGDAFVQVDNQCALRASGKVGCWQAGDTVAASIVNWDVSTFSYVELEEVVEIQSDCGLYVDGDVVCWSYASNTDGNRVDVNPALTGITTLMNSPVAVVCGLNGAGDVRCYGDGSSGNTAGMYGTSTPVAYWFEGYFTLQNGLPSGSIKTASFNGTGACAVLQDKTVACWGENLHGMLAVGPNAMHSSFLEAPILNDTWLGTFQSP